MISVGCLKQIHVHDNYFKAPEIYLDILILYNTNNIQLSPEGEVNSGGYIPRREASRYISPALHKTVNIQGYSKLWESIKMRKNCYPLIW